MARQKITAVRKVAFERLRAAFLDRQDLGQVVAIDAFVLSVTACANCGPHARLLCMLAQPLGIVRHERDGAKSFHVVAVVAGAALPLLELCLVLMAAEALGHGRKHLAVFTGHFSVTANALAVDRGHLQVFVVRKTDRVTERWACTVLRYGLQLLGCVLLVALRTDLGIGCQRRLVTGLTAVASAAAQAFRLTLTSAMQVDHVQLVGELGDRPLVAGERSAQHERTPQQPRAQTRAAISPAE